LFHDRELIEGVTVFADERNAADPAHPIYYLLPEQPRFRLDADGKPVFRFIKYRTPIDRADGKKGGGFVIFDVEFVVPDDKRTKIVEILSSRLPPPNPRDREPPRVELATIAYTKGTASVLLFQESGALVEKITSPGKPSLYGNNVCSVTVELTDIGAPVAEQALQGQGGVVQVRYDLSCAVKLPDVKIDGRFHATQFYSFYQDIQTDWDLWGDDSYRETLREKLYQSESLTLVIDGGPIGASNPDLLAELKSWAQKALEDAVARNMLSAATPVAADDRGLKGDAEDVTRDIVNHKISDVSLRVRERAVIEWSPAPQGTLPNITSLKDADGNPLRWEDYATSVSADDPFFRTLRVRASVNADFAALKLYSVDVDLAYDSPDGVIRGAPGKVTAADQVVALDAYRGPSDTYRYSYKVNYQGESRSIDVGPIEATAPFLTINVGDLGYLAVDVQPGDVDFAQVDSVFVVMSYEDGTAVPRIEEQFTLTKDAASRRAFDQPIFVPVRQPYRYRATYRMKDGKELITGEIASRAPRLYINDPFSAIYQVNLRSWGNLEDHVKEIIVELEYADEANDYRRTVTETLSKARPFATWEFPVVRETGTRLSYSVLYTFHDGRPPVEVPRTEASERTLLFGLEPPDKAKLSVEVLADLVDFTQVKLAKVTLQYDDADDDVHESGSTVFKAGAPTSWKWTIDIKDKNEKAYAWSATYYMVDGTHRDVGPTTTADGTLVLEVPNA
jgi:hypothetical protein